MIESVEQPGTMLIGTFSEYIFLLYMSFTIPLLQKNHVMTVFSYNHSLLKMSFHAILILFLIKFLIYVLFLIKYS